MSNPMIQPSGKMMETNQGKKELLVYELEALDVLRGPLVNLSKTVEDIVSFSCIKARTQEDYLLIKVLTDKVVANFSDIVVKMTHIYDPNSDIELRIDQVVKKYPIKKEG